jgi:hypothetical protein
MLPQGNATFAGFVVARQRKPDLLLPLALRESKEYNILKSPT